MTQSKLNVKIIECTPNPERLIATSAKLCYSPTDIKTLMDDLTEEKTTKFVNMLLKLGHSSPFEHASFTFAIEGVSRVFETQNVRHRHSSFSIQSGRYVNRDNPEFIYPKAILDNEKALEIYEHHIQDSTTRYNEIVAILKKEYIDKGMTSSNAEKKAIENARYLTPQSISTRIIMTKNVRDLWHFFNERCCTRSQDEMQKVANLMLQECKKVSPLLFKNAGAKCVTLGCCPEGKMCCGRCETKETILENARKYKELSK